MIFTFPKRKIIQLSVLLVVVCISFQKLELGIAKAAPAVQIMPSPVSPTNGSVVITKNPGAVKSTAAKNNIKVTRELKTRRGESIVVLNTMPESAVARGLRADRLGEVYPNYLYRLADTPTDPSYPNQWSLPKIKMPQAWDVTTGSSNTVIAVIDSGVLFSQTINGTTHTQPDFPTSRRWENAGEKGATASEGAAPNCTSRSLALDKSCNNLDDDTNGQIDDWQGWDFMGGWRGTSAACPNYNDAATYNHPTLSYVLQDNDPQPYSCDDPSSTSTLNKSDPQADSIGHGTMVAGVAAAQTNNGALIAGMDRAAKIMNLRVIDGYNYSETAIILAAIEYATDNGASIINLSLTTGCTAGFVDNAIETALAAAKTAGVTTVAAAGNNGTGVVCYPASSANAIGVGSTNQSDQRSSWSSYGPELDVVAPGEDIVLTNAPSAAVNSNLATASGTSFAAPHVAGLIGLIKAQAPSATPVQIQQILQASADKVAGMNGQNRTDQYGYGMVNAIKALSGGETNIGWNFENLDGGNAGSVSSYTNAAGKFSVTTSFGGNLHAFYYDSTSGDLRHAQYNGVSWSFQNLDGAGGIGGRVTGNVGETVSVAEFGGKLNVFYHDATNSDLRHAQYDGVSWTFATLDGGGGGGGRIASRVGLWPSSTVYASSLQVFYYDYQNGNLRHAWSTNGTNWNFEDLDGSNGSIAKWNSNVGDTSAAMVYKGTLQLYYYDSSFGNLRHAWADNTGWHFEHLDGTIYGVSRTEDNTGRNPTLVEFSGTLQLFYSDLARGNLRHAWANSSGWHFENLDGEPSSVGQENANLGTTPRTIVFENKLYVFYYNTDTHSLRHAYADNTGWHFGNIDGSSYSASLRDSIAGLYPSAIPFGSPNALHLIYYDSTTTSLRHAWGSLLP